jgi:hypothetical protein
LVDSTLVYASDFLLIAFHDGGVFIGEELFDGSPALKDVVMNFVPDLLLFLKFGFSIDFDESSIFFTKFEGFLLETGKMFCFFERSVAHLAFVVLSFARVLNLLFLHEGCLLLTVLP